MAIMDDKYYSTAEVAERFSVAVGTVRKWIRTEGLAAIEINGRWRISERALEEFANRKFEKLQKTRYNS